MKKKAKSYINITIWILSGMAAVLGYAILMGDTVFGRNMALGLSIAIPGTLIYLLYFVANRHFMTGGKNDR